MKYVMVTTAALALGSPAFAQSLSSADMEFAFGGNNSAHSASRSTEAAPTIPESSQSIEVASARDMTMQEMEDTEGAWLPAVRFGWGAVGGGVSYTVANAGTDNFSWGGLGRSVTYGGVGGLFGWNNPSSAILGSATSSGLSRWGW